MTFRRRIALTVAAAVLAVPVAAAASSNWTHWTGEWFTCWIPTRSWHVVEGQNNLNVSSPTGDAIVTYQYATNAPAPVTPLWVASLVFRYQNEDLHPLTGVRLMRRSGVSALPGGQRQVFEWTGIRRDSGQPVHGVLIADSFADTNTGAYGYEAYAKAAPASQWRALAPLLEAIRAHISFYGHE